MPCSPFIRFALMFFLLVRGLQAPYACRSQTVLSDADRQAIIQQLKKELLDSLKAAPPKRESSLTFSGYLELYYSFDFANPEQHQRQPFVYSFNRHNELNLNLGFLKLAFANEKVRSNLAIMAGTYANDNLSSETGVLKNIFEANVGFKLSKKHDVWLDAGVFASHIGFESAIGKDCWNLTRSILADNSPYYESGVKVTYSTPNQKWLLSGLLLNGWQRIYRKDGNNLPSFGHQLTYKPHADYTFNSSSWVGSDAPDSIRLMRYFHNFYAQMQFRKWIGMIIGFDVGAQQAAKQSSKYLVWYAPVMILRFSPAPQWNLAVRAEYYHDPDRVIIALNTPGPFRTLGYSVNLDYQIHRMVLWRIEGRGLRSSDPIFTLKEKASKHNFFFTSSLAFSF